MTKTGKQKDDLDPKKSENSLNGTEERLKKLNRILTAHNKTNQARLKTLSEYEYLNAVCKTISEDCGHAMVWIGYSHNDKNKSVRPMAYAGFDEKYLESLDITWAENDPRGQGPTGTAIRTGKITQCADMETDPKFAPWRENALKHGYRSSISFPLVSNKKVFGALTIFDTKPNAFDREEIEMLADLVVDISNGISSLRMEAMHQRDEEQLRRSEERYRSLFAQMTEGFALYEIICDKSGVPVDFRFLEVNEAFEKITGLKRENILYKFQSSVLPEEDPSFLKKYGDVALSRTPIRFTQYSKALGKYYDIVAFSPEEGQFATLLSDVTEQVEAEKAKNNFIAVMAHELRNPLMPISLNAEMLNSQLLESRHLSATEPQMRDEVNVIMRQTKIISRLLDDLLDISRIIHGKISLKKQIIDISIPIQDALSAIRPFIEAQKHAFTYNPPESPVYIDADPVRIEQVISNLLNNAAKYTHSGGKIGLSVAVKEHFVEIRVKDNGIGLHSKDFQKIFELFSRSAKPFVETGGDLGLGLKITKDIVSLHKGTIGVISAGVGEGSEFIVRLPMISTAPIKKPENENYSAVIGRKILVVDDNKDIAVSLNRILTRLGNTLEIANDGESAIQTAMDFDPEVVLLDIGLPDMTGYDVARKLRERFGQKIKLVALTGYGQEKDKTLSKEAGFDFHLTKPVSINDISRVISECFKKQ
ncbi:MAG: ATP-binding protein [Candidatus Paceibacterota bacterium]|jgi:PAS domain S-box-containing protein|nr:ATP-binding protein [Candidatus Paceibacterota bacterium]